MKVIDFEITFEYMGKKIEASCQKFKMYRVPHIRVVYGKPMKEHIHVFWEVDSPNKGFFWFPLPALKEGFAKAINEALKKSRMAKAKVE
jgi:hypothetical protein